MMTRYWQRAPRPREGKTGLGARLASARIAAGLTQAQAAQAAGIPYRSVQCWEQGTRSPRVDKLPALAKVYGVTLDALLRDD